MQIVRREQPAVAVQVLHRGLERRLRRKHPRFVRRQVALAQVARRAGGDDVAPRGVAAARARDQVIEGEVVARAAKLAGEAVAQEHVEPRERRMGRGLHIGLERHHAGQLHLEARRAHRAVVIGDDVDPFQEHRLDGVLPRPQRQRVIAQRTEIRVEHQRRKPRWRYMSVQDDAPTSTQCRSAALDDSL